MAYTKAQVQAVFPDVQWVGGKGIVHLEGKNVVLGDQAVGEMFNANEAGAALLDAVLDTSKPAARRGRPPAQATEE